MGVQVISAVALSIIALGSTVQAQMMTDEWRRLILEHHNEARRQYPAADMLELEYDPLLEQVAARYIKETEYFDRHNPKKGDWYGELGGNREDDVGENWWSDGPENAVWAWTDCKWPWGNVNGCTEREEWIAKSPNPDPLAARNSTELNRANRDCRGRGNWLHFSAIMWAKTRKVGCSWSKKFGTLCNYSPRGNMYEYDGSFPMVKVGKPCSQCPDAYPDCVDGLCTRCS